MKNKKLWIGIGIIIVFGIIVFGFFNNYSKRVEDNVIYIGAILPLTGAQSQDGVEIRNSLLLALNSVNEKRDCQIKLLIEDSKDIAKDAITAFNKLLSKNPIAIIVGGSAISMAVAPLGDKYQIPIVCLLASDETLPNVNDWTFRSFPLDKDDAKAMASFAYQDLGIRTIAVLWVNNEQGISFSKCLQDDFEKEGGRLICSEAYDIGAVDLKSEIEKIISYKSDAIYVFGYGIGFSTCFSAIKQAKYSGNVLSWAPLSLPFNLQSVGQSGEGVYLTAPCLIKSDEEDKYINNYKEMTAGDMPGYIGAMGYETLRMISSVLHRDTTRIELRNELMNIRDYDSIVGKIGFNGSRGLTINPAIWIIKNGQLQLVKNN